MSGEKARIMDFVMSCRVMGKKVEEAVLGYTLQQARAMGAEHVAAPLFDGPRNLPARSFFFKKFMGDEGAELGVALVAVPPEIKLTEADREAVLF
jgi:predicted enzyme involved in methoxymalonyl-ACP biosynthesis